MCKRERIGGRIEDKVREIYRIGEKVCERKKRGVRNGERVYEKVSERGERGREAKRVRF